MQEKSCPCQRNLETFQNMRRCGRPCPPLKSYEFVEDFHKNGIFCGRTEASAPTVLWRIFRKVRRGRCPHRPGKMRRFYRNPRRIRSFSWGDVGIAPYARLRHSMCSRAPYAWLERRKRRRQSDTACVLVILLSAGNSDPWDRKSAGPLA